MNHLRSAGPRRILLGVLLGLSSYVATAHAQGPILPVQWSGSAQPARVLTRDSKLSIELSAVVERGWHVYGFSQSPGGPIPLKIAIDDNQVLLGTGAASGTAPVKKHDAALDLDTESYTGTFTLRLPAQVKDHPATGKQDISVSVRFQACSDRTCLPPKTVHILIPVEVGAGS
jgi:hypothetical protein